jgi:hypothetical protein
MIAHLKPVLLAGAVAVIAVGGATRGAGQAAAPEQSCVYMADVRRTTILDDNNILFHMRNGDVYQNRLRSTCFMLKSANRFTYGSSALRRLCVGDLIQVLPDPNFVGATCTLGSYMPIDKEVADELVATAQGKRTKESRSRQVLKTEPVELPAEKPPTEATAPPADPQPVSPSPPAEAPKP